MNRLLFVLFVCLVVNTSLFAVDDPTEDIEYLTTEKPYPIAVIVDVYGSNVPEATVNNVRTGIRDALQDRRFLAPAYDGYQSSVHEDMQVFYSSGRTHVAGFVNMAIEILHLAPWVIVSIRVDAVPENEFLVQTHERYYDTENKEWTISPPTIWWDQYLLHFRDDATSLLDMRRRIARELARGLETAFEATNAVDELPASFTEAEARSPLVDNVGESE